MLLDNYKRKREKRRRKEAALRRSSLKRYNLYLKKRRRRLITNGIKLACYILIPICIIFGIVSCTKHKSEQKHEEEKQQVEAETLQRETVETQEIDSLEKDITIGATGCMILHDDILKSDYYQNGDSYDFSEIFKYIKDTYSEMDYMTCEFEGTLPGKDYSGYPKFHCPDVFAQNIADSGVDLQMLATNHIYDSDSSGFRRTSKAFDEMGLAKTGVRTDENELPYYIADIDGIKVGFIDYVCEARGIPGVAVNLMTLSSTDGELLNSYDLDALDQFYEEIGKYAEDMKAAGAQFLIANMHWGDEYKIVESSSQDKIAQKLCDLGFDALIGGHPHCEQPIDVITTADNGHQMLCIYSVGNELSNQRRYRIDSLPTGHTEDGVIVKMTLHQDKNEKVALTGVDLIPTWVYSTDEEQNNEYYILPVDQWESIEQITGIAGVKTKAKESYDRTMEVLGPGLTKAQKAFR